MHFKRNFLIIWTYKVDHRTPVQGQVKYMKTRKKLNTSEAWHGGAYLCFHYLGGGDRRMRSWNLSSVVSWVGGQLGYRRQPPSQKSSQNGKTKPFRLTKQKCGYCSAPGRSQTFQVRLLRRRSWCWRLWAPRWLLLFCAFSVVITPHFPSVWLMWCQLKISKLSGCSLMSYYTAWSLNVAHWDSFSHWG